MARASRFRNILLVCGYQYVQHFVLINGFEHVWFFFKRLKNYVLLMILLAILYQISRHLKNSN